MRGRIAILTIAVLALCAHSKADSQKSEWIATTSEGKLTYKSTPAGDRIMDFSFAGYGGGGVAIPIPPVVKALQPSGGEDDSAAIQAAIDEVAKGRIASNFRGAILLSPGTFLCKSPIKIAESGVVLRGSGSGEKGTILKLAGTPHLCLSIKGPSPTKSPDKGVKITDAYVPSGTNVVTVADASAFKVGDVVHVLHPVTPEWVAYMGMDKMVRDGKAEHWVSGTITTERSIAKIDRNRITLDIPLSDALDSKHLGSGGAILAKAAPSNRITQVGIENLRIVSPPQEMQITDPHFQAIRIDNVADAWVRDLAIEETVNSVGVGHGARRVTLQNISINHTVATKGAAKPGDFGCDGSQILFDRCSGKCNDVFYLATGGAVTGPNVMLNCTFHGNGHIQPHMRWATGLLIDGCKVPEGGIDFMNRGQMGSGHGWTMGWAVAWNCTAKTFVIQNPPGCYNWAIGCIGKQEQSAMPFAKSPLIAKGEIDSEGKPVTPASLYLAQLRERLGADAVKNIGY